MRILLVYGSNTGGTYEAGTLIRDVLKGRRHAVVMKNARDIAPATFSRFDAVVLGSCTWEKHENGKRIEGSVQQDVELLQKRLASSVFPHTRFAVYVLGDRNFTYFCKAADHLQEFVSRMQGRKIGRTLRVDRFNYDLVRNRARVTAWAKTLANALARAA